MMSWRMERRDGGRKGVEGVPMRWEMVDGFRWRWVLLRASGVRLGEMEGEMMRWRR